MIKASAGDMLRPMSQMLFRSINPSEWLHFSLGDTCTLLTEKSRILRRSGKPETPTRIDHRWICAVHTAKQPLALLLGVTVFTIGIGHVRAVPPTMRAPPSVVVAGCCSAKKKQLKIF